MPRKATKKKVDAVGVLEGVSPKDFQLGKMVAEGMSKRSALRAVGSKSAVLPKGAQKTLDVLRAEMAQDKITGFNAVVQRLGKRATNKKVAVSDQNTADKMLIKIGGYEAPAQVQLHQRTEISTVALSIQTIVAKLGGSIADLPQIISPVDVQSTAHPNTIKELRAERVQSACAGLGNGAELGSFEEIEESEQEADE